MAENRPRRLGKERVQVRGPNAQAQVGGVLEGLVHAVDATARARALID